MPGAVQRAVQALQERSERLMVYGQGEHIDTSGAVFFRRTMWLLLGKFDEELKTAFDFDYWLRAFARFSDRIGFVDAAQAQSRLHPDCITLRLRRTVILEGMQLLARHQRHAPKEWLLTYVNQLLALPPSE